MNYFFIIKIPNNKNYTIVTLVTCWFVLVTGRLVPFKEVSSTFYSQLFSKYPTSSVVQTILNIKHKNYSTMNSGIL